MAIGFIRVEYVKRSQGQNACYKSAYNSRDIIHFKGHEFADACVYNWSNKTKCPFQEVLLPAHVDEVFKSREVLWNAAEEKETRKNSQIAIDLLLALPDDEVVSPEDKMELARSFVQLNFVDKGLAAQIDVHPPEKKVHLSLESGEIEDLEHNWHAHVLITTRRFTGDGKGFADKKARDLMPDVKDSKFGVVVTPQEWSKRWIAHQNLFFEDKGLSLRVDPNGIVGEIHLGPRRLRGKTFDLLEKNDEQKQLNVEAINDPVKLLEKIVERSNIFTPDDIKNMIYKFIGHAGASELVNAVINQKNVIQLLDPDTKQPPLDPDTGKPIEKYTTIEVLLEEKRCLALADNIQKKNAFKISGKAEQFASNLTDEQRTAFHNILNGSRLSCIEGYAGTGKSYLLVALKDAYEKEGYTVRAFGPDSETAKVLMDKGFKTADNVYQFLFNLNRQEKEVEKENRNNYWKATQLKRGRPYFSKIKEKDSIRKKESIHIEHGKEVWLVDESTKLGNRPMLQILKLADKYDAQVVFSGGVSQLRPIERGGMYETFVKAYGAQKLESIQRQKNSVQRTIAEKIAKGDIAGAIDRLTATNGIIWVDASLDRKNSKAIDQSFVDKAFPVYPNIDGKLSDRQKAIEVLISKWAADRAAFPNDSSLIIACSNDEVRTLNEMVRIYRKEKGEISTQEFACETQFGNIFISEGDTLAFCAKNNELGVTNGMQGTIIKASSDQFTVLIKTKGKPRKVTFNPNKYASFKLGYATTYFGSQGRDVDRAYVLHSPYTNKEMFLVALTRHVQKAYLFIPKSNFNYLSYLKAQAAGYQDGYNKYLSLNDYFKNKETQDYLQDLIDQTNQSDSKQITADFTTDTQKQQEKRELYVKDLKTSSSPVNRFKGYALSVFDHASRKIEIFQQSKVVCKSDKAFFSPVIEKLSEKIRVKEMAFEPAEQEKRKIFVQNIIQHTDQLSTTQYPITWEGLSKSNQQTLRSYLQQANEAWSFYQKVEKESNGDENKTKSSTYFADWQVACGKRNESAYHLAQTVPKEVLNKLLGNQYIKKLDSHAASHEQFLKNQSAGIQEPQPSVKQDRSFEASSLSQSSIKLLETYQQKSGEAASFYSIVQIESEGEKDKQRSSSHYIAWQVACGKRNASAYQLIQSVSKENLSIVFSKSEIQFLGEQSQRHEYLINLKDKRPLDIDAKLKDNLESLLYRLFPEGPSIKNRNNWRFGSKGALAVTLNGEKMGSYYSFKEGKGGGPINLIQATLGLNAREAQDWAKNFLGGVKDLHVPAQFRIQHKQVGKEPEWISMKPGAHNQAPSLRNLPKCKLGLHYQESMRHAYRDEQGAVLYYTLRLISKKDPSKKIVLPLSYGIEKESNGKPHWALKNYQSDQRPLYNLHLIKQNPDNKIVIVEGEKTADAANKLLSNHGMIVLTWSGGAKATAKTDWSPLCGKQIIIWPDNDKAGYEASDSICSELRKTGVKSLHVVDKEVLSKEFPLKWDLADPLPEGKDERFVKDLLLSAKEKSIGLDHLFVGFRDGSSDLIDKLRINEVLWRVEERLRPALEKKHESKPLEIKHEIQQETMKILNDQKNVEKQIKTDMGIGEDLSKRLAYQSILYQAATGKLPSSSSIQEMRQILANIGQGAQQKICVDYEFGNFNTKLFEYAVDKFLSSIFCSGIIGTDAQKQIETIIQNQSTHIVNQFSGFSEIEKTNKLTLDNENIKQNRLDMQL